MNSFLEGILLGLGVCVPVGPINIMILNYATKSYKSALALGFGAVSGDLFYLFLLYFGVLKFINNAIFLDYLSVVGFFILSYLAYLMVKSSTEFKENKKEFKTGIWVNYFKGFLINISNPYIITFWLSIATMLKENKDPILLILAVVITIISWVFALSFVVHKYTHFFTSKTLKIINIISAIILEYFAILLILRRFYDF